MSFLHMKTLVTNNETEKSDAVDKCITQIYDGSLELPSPDQIQWAVETTATALNTIDEARRSLYTKHFNVNVVDKVFQFGGLFTKLTDALDLTADPPSGRTPRSPDGPMMLRLCTALLLTNKLSKDQIDHLIAKATEAITEDWENAKDCAVYINATTQGITAVENWVERHDSRGTQGTYEYDQEIASFTSANESLQMGIKMSAEAEVPAYGGKVSAESSLEKRYETAWSETKKTSTKQTFEFKKGEREFLCQKTYHVKQGEASKDFLVDVQRFTLADLTAKTGLTPK